MLRVEGFDLNDISVDVINGVVVLSGAAPNPEDKVEAERIAWSAPGVRQVGNEVQVGSSLGFGSKTKDEVISTAVRTRLAASNDVRNLNYTIETRRGVVYLMGVARSEFELAEAARIASVTRGVREVVSYVTISGEMPNAYDTAPQPSVVAQNRPSGSAPSAPPSNPDDLSFWGTPVPSGPITDTAPPPASGAAPYSAPIDPSAPLPYRPGTTELDPDAITSGEPVYRDPVTKEIITLPPGTQVIPYQPDEGPGSLGHGGNTPPGYASNGQAQTLQTSSARIILPDQTVRTVIIERPAPLAAPVTLQTPTPTSAAVPSPAVKWDGEKWVPVQ